MLQFPTMPKLKTDRSFLEAALVGFGHQLWEVTLKIAEIKRMLGRGEGGGKQTQSKRKPVSAAGRARMAAGQRKRWAVAKKGQARPAKQSPPKKRKMSAAARRRIGEATRQRWAEYRAKKVAAKSS